MDWDKLRVFSVAAEAGSFTNAGYTLRRSQSAISRQITALEHDLGAMLFHRHARGLKLTEQGEMLQKAVGEVTTRLSMAEALLAEYSSVARGSLKISADATFGAFWLVPRLKEFQDRYPDISVTLMLDGGDADLSMGHADVAISMSMPSKNNLLQRRILSARCYAYAAPEYLRTYGYPSHSADLDRHRLVVLRGGEGRSGTDDAWLLRLGATGAEARRPNATLDNVHGLYQAVKSGLGIGALPYFIEPEAAGLVRVLTDAASPRREGYLVYPAELRDSKRITVFRDFLLAKIAEANLHRDPLDRLASPHFSDGPPGTDLRRTGGRSEGRKHRASLDSDADAHCVVSSL
ncbi:MAG: LysR family transcriptional regulator [Aliidongia sp.]